MIASDRIDWRLGLKAGLVQLLTVGIAFAVLAIALPTSFFEDWGVVAGPLVWIGCSVLTALILALPLPRALLVAAGAGLAGGLAGRVIGHDAGIVVAIALFALGCALSDLRE